MLLRTKEGVVVQKDWTSARISRAYVRKPPAQGQCYDSVQEALLAKPKAALTPPRPVLAHPNIERLVRFFA